MDSRLERDQRQGQQVAPSQRLHGLAATRRDAALDGTGMEEKALVGSEAGNLAPEVFYIKGWGS